jgi:hypothetical protein
MRNLDRVVQHMNQIQDKSKAERVEAFVRALERRKQRLQKTMRTLQKQQSASSADQATP